ncbi:hypothetical protein [Pseudonocardia oroxyli]|uniref:ParE toxin of type II toxin-antitoxin system, parDE n=1 Tax=Pseudonocardia oroxyli TaxID=366584 RepID=A0A1G7P9N6_PSEOR|nr:hypothetical protein [Pseudonocardia oroxyli]SDF82983.1 hypothetical protein SAMN05216377_10755 [Pseudonocardia oroxyli]
MYDVTTDQQAHAQLDALPAEALGYLAEARAVLEVAPWNGEPINTGYPDAPVRTLLFGAHGEGMVVYLILEDRRQVDLLKILWLS